MKILQIIPYFFPSYSFGGPVQVSYELCRELVKKGHDVVVYTADAEDIHSRLKVSETQISEGIEIHYFKNISMYTVRKLKLFITPDFILKIKKEIKNFDIVHMHEYRSFQNIFACYYAKQNAVPYILQAHGSLEKINKSRIKSFYDLTFGYDMLKNASGVIALTEVEAKQYIDMGASNEKIVVVPNGIDLSEYATLPSKGLFKKKFNIADNKKIILYLGRINKVKGIDFLVESYSYLINKINFKDVVLVIAGPDDGYLSDLKNLIYSLKLDDYVLLTGMLSKEDKISAFRDSDVCAYLNPIEPFGLVPLESAVSMTPVIVIDGTPMAKIVKEGEFGLTTNYGDVNALANIFKDILQDENFTQKMGICGRKYVSSNFNWSQIILKLEKMYEDVIKGYSYQRSNI